MQIAQIKFQARQKERQLEEEKIQLQEKLELLQMQDNFDEEFPDESLEIRKKLVQICPGEGYPATQYVATELKASR